MAKLPVWQGIAETITAEIADGLYPPGAKLPTEAEQAQRFGVNRHTVRRALAHLAEEGLVLPRRGAGVFVAREPTDYAIGKRVRFSQNIAALGRVPNRQILRLETRLGSREETDALKIEPGAKVHVYEGVSLAGDDPVALAISIFPAARFPALLDAIRTHNSITQGLRDCGLTDYVRTQTRVTAQPARPAEARHLEIADGAPVLVTHSINQDTEGRPIEYGIATFAADRVTLTFEP